jgi:hypothetical protein
MKICIIEGCNNFIYTHGYCKYHSHLYYNSNCDKVVRNSTKYKQIPKQSLKRIEINKLYFQLCKQLKEHAVKTNTFYCIFCGEKLTEENDWHHTNGRDGDMILAKHYLKPAHRLCHTKYHSWTVSQLEQEVWYKAFLYRLKLIDEKLYDKEINKSLKS